MRTPAGDPFPDRAAVVFFAYVIVLLTLVPPGLTLGPLIGRLGLRRGAARRRSLAEARSRLLHAALQEVETLATDAEIGDEAADRLRSIYEARLDRLAAVTGEGAPADHGRTQADVQHAIIRAQRRELRDMRRTNAYPGELLRELGRELDLEEARLPRRRPAS